MRINFLETPVLIVRETLYIVFKIIYYTPIYANLRVY